MRFFSVLAAVVAVQAQLEHSYEDFAPRTARVGSPVVALPLQDNKALLQNEEQVGKMYTFGIPVPVNVGLVDGQWSEASNGRVWSVTFESEEAHSLNLKFSRFHIPEGAALWIYGNGPEIQGAYTHENNYESGEFGNWPMVTDRITVEYFHPHEVTEEPQLFISEVVHGYKGQPSKRECGDSGYCNVNSACDPQFGGLHADQIRGGGILLNGDGDGYCSGSMINTIGNIGRQLFLTAAHCGESHTAIKFYFASSSCEPSNCPAGNNVASLNVLVRQTESDFTLVEIGEPIPAAWNLYLSGFSASSTPTDALSGIHHPSADVQKMAYAYKAPTYDRWSGTGPSTHWRVASWDNQTTTEGGSSGSPLFNSQQQIIGQLHGGSASCYNMAGYDIYGGIYYSWSQGLSTFLNPLNQNADSTNGIDLNTARKA